MVEWGFLMCIFKTL